MLFIAGSWGGGIAFADADFGKRNGYWNDYSGFSPTKDAMGYYHIKDASNLAYVAYAIENGIDGYLNGKLILDADIDMSAHYWKPIDNWKGSIDGQNHTITGLYAYRGESDHSGFCGYTEDGVHNMTIENVTFRNCYAQGARNVGIIIGYLDDNTNVTFKNVRVENCKVSTAQWENGCGFIGYIQGPSKVKFENCYSDVYTGGYTKKNVGGFIGKSAGNQKTEITFTNCVSQMMGNNYFYKVSDDAKDKEFANRGGFVGLIEKNTIIHFNNVAVIDGYNGQTLKSYGALVGSCKTTNVEVSNAYISNAATLANDALWRTFNYTFGTDYPNHNWLVAHTKFYNIMPDNTMGKEQLVAAYEANQQSGALFGYNGSCITPCSSAKGSIVRFASNTTLSQLRGGNITDGIVGQYAYMSQGDTMVYTVEEDPTHWVCDDETDNKSLMFGKSRIGKWQFKGVPQKSGDLKFKVLERPIITLTDTTFNSSRMTVTLKWTSNQGTDLEGYWKQKKGQIRVYRNGECIDTLNCNATQWEDKLPLYGQTNEYELRFACPDLYYDEADNVSTPKWKTKAEWDGYLNLSISGSVGNLKLNVPMPNSKALDGGKMVLYKVALMPGSETEIPDDETLEQKGTAIAESVFHSTSGNNDFEQVSFTDNTTNIPCSKWVYQVVVQGFNDPVYKDMKAVTNKVSFVDPTELSIPEFTASKGVSTDQIKVEWKTTTNKKGNIVRYELARVLYKKGVNYERLIDGAIKADWKTVYTTDNANSVNVYNDNVLPGYVYVYRLRAYAACDGTFLQNVYSTAADIGYAASRGTIMGSIVYGAGSTAVEGVDVRLDADDNSLTNKADVFSFYFRGATDCLPLADNLPASFWDSDWTLNFLLRPQNSDNSTRVAAVPGKWALDICNRTLSIDSTKITLPAVNDFSFVMLRHDSGEGKLYLGYTNDADQGTSKTVWSNGISDADAAKWFANNAVADSLRRVPDGVLVFGQATQNDVPFTGHLDEVRLWSKQLTDVEITNTYNRYLTGNEASLEAYYTFDAGVGEFAFDNSHPDGLWNSRNVRLPQVGYPIIVSNVTPSTRNLSYRSTTDKNGEYQIAGVPYSGEGTNYQVVPVFGTHEFKPASTRRYVSAQSLTHSEVNFTDQSSFRVPVQAYYVYGNIPAEGLNVSVDGVLQMDDNNKYITTDADGKAVVNVPIGRHRLALVGAKHTMVNKGYPSSITSVTADGMCSFASLTDRQGYIDFQADYAAAATFYDSTFVRVVGRVAGGKDEESKPLGFAKSVGNLGQAVLEIAPNLTKTYMVNNGNSDITPIDTIPAIKSTLVFPAKSTTVRITTDPATGEFTALLPPLKWEVKSVRAVKDGMSDFGDLSSYINNFKLDPTVESCDTLWNDSLKIKDPTQTDTYKTFKYQASQKYILYTKPEMTLVNLNAPEGYESMLGEEYALMQYLDEQTNTVVDDTVRLWNKAKHDGSDESYAMGMPVFRTGDNYRMQIRIFEKYKNHDNDSISAVPVRNANVTVYNRWSNKLFYQRSTGDYDLGAFVDTAQVVTNDKDDPGTVEYDFVGGVPNPTEGDFSLPMTISYTVNGVQYSEAYNGYVMGIIEKGGSNFVTEAPKEVFAVLFDPPGSNSSAFMETGTTITAKWNISDTGTLYSGTTFVDRIGVATAISAVAGTSITTLTNNESNTSNTNEVTVKSSEGWSYDFSKSYTLKERIQTGSDAKHVGAMGDVYIGRNINWVYTPSYYIMLKEVPSASGKFAVTSESGHHYQISKWEQLGKFSKDSTSFRLSQYDIVNTQIPDLVKKRNALTTFVDELPDPESVTKVDDKYLAFALKSVENKEHWDSGTDFITIDPAQVRSYDFVEDLVTRFNSAIGQWQSLIEAVEKKKYTMFTNREKNVFTEWSNSSRIDYGFIDNYSFDGGTTLSRNFTSTESTTGAQTTSVSLDNSWIWESKFKTETAIAVAGKLKNKSGVTAEIKRSGSDAESRSSTFGYTLSDNNIGDHFSVDVFMPGSLVKQKSNHGSISALLPNTIFMAEPFMFCTRAGQSRTPYEKPQMSLYYKVNNESVPLDDGTVSLDEPFIKFEKHDILNVPSGTTASVKMTVANNSTATTAYKAFIYNLYLTNKDNTNGLDIRIDGQPIAGGITFSLPPGTKIERTVTFKQTRLDVTDYRNLSFKLMLGENAVDSVNVSFAPAAPSIKMVSNDGYLINSSSKQKSLMFKLSDYSADFYAFTGVRLQYKQKAEQTWHTQRMLINDTKRYQELSGQLPNGWRQLNANDTCYIDFTSMPEGTYEVRAQSFSLIGPQNELTYNTEPITIVKDTQAPVSMGVPEPNDGIYTLGDEISITFNEPIKQDAISDDNFYVTAELNDAEVTHSTGLHFDGNTPARTASRVNIFGQNSTVAMWYKPQVGKTSCLFSQTLQPNSADSIPVKLFYNDDATLTMQFGNDIVKSQRKAIGADGKAEQDWMYAILRFDFMNRKMFVYNLSGTSNEAESSFIATSVKGLPNNVMSNVPLYVGGSKDSDNCYAEIEGLVVYDGLKSFEAAAKDKSNKHNANLRGIVAYWPMDEGYGKTAKEMVRSRNLTLNGTDNWYMPVQNYALRLNGKDQYALINTSGCPIDKNEDYTLEMMFRTASTKLDGMATLFSNGWGATGSAEDKSDLASRLSISLNENGRVVLTAAGNTYAPMGKNYADNQWHHLALCVNRDGYARVLVDTVDISNNELIAGTDLGSFSNAQMAIGALVYKVPATDAINTVVGQYFGGDIDEVRLWNAQKTIANVRSSVDMRLNGNEPGLVAYYPFERTDEVANQLKTTPTLSDRTAANDNTGFVPATDPTMMGFGNISPDMLAEAATTDQGPRLKAPSVKSRINVNWVFSQVDRNKIVLSFPSELSKARIEDCIVNFTVRDLFDENGNRMAQPETWSVYVSQQALYTYLDNTSLTQEIGTSTKATLTIWNTYGSTQNWQISNLPSWLTASATEGTISPMSTSTVTLTTDEGQGVGNYQDVLVINDSEGLQQLIPVNLTVTGNRPGWNVDVDSDEWMAIMGRIKIDDNWCNDENSLVAAFDANGHCHGVASPTYDSSMDAYFVHMNLVGGMPATNARLSFKVWDASTGLVYSNVNFTSRNADGEYTVDSLMFADKSVLGSFGYPCVFATDKVTHQEIKLKAGWNWTSLWVDPKADNYKKLFGKGVGVVMDVKRQYPTDADHNPINDVNLSEAFHIYASEDGTLDISGAIANPEDWEVRFPYSTRGKATWKWLGYPVGTRLTLNEAFADFKPTTNDIVKSQKEYAIYNGRTWVGTLKYLTPGEGYIYGYYGMSDALWHYPTTMGTAVAAEAPTAKAPTHEGLARFANDAHRYAGNATVLAHVTLDGAVAAGYDIAAFVNGECRGWTTVDSTGTAYLTVAGDAASESVRYRMSDPATGAVTAVRGQDSYAVNATIGNTTEPRELRAEQAAHFQLDVTPANYEDYTYLTATVLDADGTPYGHDFELAAFSESGECRGVCAGQAGKDAEIAIYGEPGETFSFRLYDKTTMEEVSLSGTKQYDALTPCLTATLRVGTDGISGIGVDTDGKGNWYSVPGVRHSGKPSHTGVYIKGHRKTAVVSK